MSGPAEKCVIVIDPELGPGITANVAALIALSLGHHAGHLIGHDLRDASGAKHTGLLTQAVPILAAESNLLPEVWSKGHDAGLVVVDFTDLPQKSRTYPEYEEKLTGSSSKDLNFLGVGLLGESKAVTRITGSLALLR